MSVLDGDKLTKNKMNLKNGRTNITLNERGAVSRIKDIKSGQVYFDAIDADRRLFHLIVPSPTWASRSIASHEAKHCSITENKSGCVLHYESLEINGKETGISAEVCFNLPAGTDEIQMSLKLNNTGAETITGAIFPWINGWTSPGNPASDKMMLGPVNEIKNAACMPKWTPAWGNGMWAQEETREYPVFVSVPWIDFSGELAGVSCINYQTTPRLCFAAAKNMAGHDVGKRVGMLWGFYAYVRPGEKWESPAIGISVHDGDWHQTADRYRQWMSTWFNPAASKREFRESIGSEHVFFHYFDGTPCRSYESLPDIAAHGREYGVRELCVWDRLALGIYGSAVSPGEDLLQYNYKEKEALANVIRQAREGGTDVSALVNFRLLNSSLDVVKNENLLEETQVALDGTRKLEQCNVAIIPGHSGLNVVFSHLGPYAHVFSPFSKKYRERILNQMQKYLDLGYQSLFYDQPFEYVPDYSCKDKGGIPEMTYAAVLESLRDVRKKLREKNPDAVIMGEQCDVFGAEVVDQWMSWGWSNLDIDSAVRLHYCLPQTVISCVVDREPGLASHAFAAGLHIMLMTKAGMGTLSDEPEFAEHIQKLAELRKKCADRTVHARFNHKRGLSVETEDSIVAYSYDGAMGPAVIIAAPEKAGKIRVHLDRGSFCRHETKKRGQLFHMDGSTSEVTDDSQELSLNKYEVLIWTA